MKREPTDKTEREELSNTSKRGRRLAANADQPRDPEDPSRRSFLGKVGGVAAVAIAAGSIPLEPLVGGRHSVAEASVVSYDSTARQAANLNYRTSTAQAEDINVGIRPDNGDATTFADFSGNYSKALVHDALGVPNRTSWLSLRNALASGRSIDFESIIVGTPGGGPNSRENGPQVSLAFDLEGRDSHATVEPPSPSVASAQTAAEQVEHYWAALLRDVPFSDYPNNGTVVQAVLDMNRLSFLRSSANNEYPFPVTPQNLFRGQVFVGDGNVQGPYVSQFMIHPTFLGVQPLSQQYQTFLPVGGGGSDFMTSVSEYQLVQNGGDSGRRLAFDNQFRSIRDGRDLAAYTHADVLYQAYFVAFLLLTQMALKAAWFYKWIVNLRMRPEEYGALVQARLTNIIPAPQASSALHPDVLISAVLPIIHSTYGSFLLPQAFPEGSPTHPCDPTGHGAVGGACITALKFFFDGSQNIRQLLARIGRDVCEPRQDGSLLDVYTGADRDSLTVNGELNKLAFNISFGHGIHAGIHFRSSTLNSILLGEQVALSVLQDRAKSYNEPFTIRITKLDGTTASITN